MKLGKVIRAEVNKRENIKVPSFILMIVTVCPIPSELFQLLELN